ncbi:ATP-dependent DNA helicase II subunit 1 [Massospora cicadina]|nr:ATP-dependent DNA helicase II subunit 1 [Massospora cicadina]
MEGYDSDASSPILLQTPPTVKRHPSNCGIESTSAQLSPGIRNLSVPTKPLKVTDEYVTSTSRFKSKFTKFDDRERFAGSSVAEYSVTNFESGVETNLDPSKDSLVIALDAGAWMSNCVDDWGTQSPLSACLETVAALAERKLKYWPEDEFGLLLYNTVTTATRNPVGLNNACLIHPFQPVSMETLLEISKLRCAARDQETTRRFWIIQANREEVDLTTTEDDLIGQLNLLLSRNVLVQGFELSLGEPSFGDTPLATLRKIAPKVYGNSEGNIHPTLKLLEWVLQASSAAVLRQQLLRRWRCPTPAHPDTKLELAPGLHIGLAIYRLYSRAKLPRQPPAQTVEEQEEEDSTEQDGESPDGCRIINYGGVHVHLTRSEIARARNVEQPGLKLLGFRKQSDFRAVHHLAPNYLLYPNEKLIPGSLVMFKALLVKMATLKVAAVGWYIGYGRITPLLVSIFPNELEMVDDAGQRFPPCLIMSILPSSVEFRHIPPLPAPEVHADEDTFSTMNSVIQKMSLGRDGFHLDEFDNPAHVLHFKGLHAIATNSRFDPNQAASEGWSHLTPISEECRSLLADLEAALNLPSLSVEETPAAKRPQKHRCFCA